MGCCVSKCRPKKLHSTEECNKIQDKLVISQAPKIQTPSSNKISPSPPSPSHSTSSFSSFTCTTSNTISSCSSLSSTATSSVLSSKDRSFSNEFLWSCVKQNPHIVRINSIKECSVSLAPTKCHLQKLDPTVKPILQQHRVHGSTAQKRVRSSSPPTLTREKSFRREPEKLNVPIRTFRSPSPSRRFNAENMIGSKEQCGSRGMLGSMRKENLRPPSPNNMNSSGLMRTCVRNKRTCTHRIGSKIDEVAVRKALCQYDSDSIPVEDIDNPLIALDCFIFL